MTTPLDQVDALKMRVRLLECTIERLMFFLYSTTARKDFQELREEFLRLSDPLKGEVP